MVKSRVLNLVEWAAVAANLLYTFLYIKGNPSCFYWGVLGPILLLVLCTDRKIYADAFLQVIYIFLAIYGWINWGEQGWSPLLMDTKEHLFLIVVFLFGGLTGGFFLKKYTDAKLPYIDSVITSGFLLATWLMMNFVHENWLYFIVLNAASVVLYANRKLYKASLMFVLYLWMSVDAYWHLGFFGA